MNTEDARDAKETIQAYLYGRPEEEVKGEWNGNIMETQYTTLQLLRSILVFIASEYEAREASSYAVRYECEHESFGRSCGS